MMSEAIVGNSSFIIHSSSLKNKIFFFDW